MQTAFKHVCEVQGTLTEIVEIIEWLNENYDNAPHNFNCYSIVEADYTTNVSQVMVCMTINFRTMEGAAAFKLKWVNE